MMPKSLTRRYQAITKKIFRKSVLFRGKRRFSVSGKVLIKKFTTGTEAILDGWWTEGKHAQAFEREFGAYLGVRYVSLVNSGSSANLVALSALTHVRSGIGHSSRGTR